MSYSFNFYGDDKESAKANISAKLDEVVANQPVHENDRELHEKLAGKMIDTLNDPGDEEGIAGSVNGSCWKADGDDGMKSAGFGFNGSVVLRTSQNNA